MRIIPDKTPLYNYDKGEKKCLFRIQDTIEITDEGLDKIYKEFVKYESANVWTVIINGKLTIHKPTFHQFVKDLIELARTK